MPGGRRLPLKCLGLPSPSREPQKVTDSPVIALDVYQPRQIQQDERELERAPAAFECLHDRRERASLPEPGGGVQVEDFMKANIGPILSGRRAVRQ